MIDKVYKSDFEPFDNWHKGRNRYAVWMYRFDDIKLKQLVLKLQKELNQYIAIKPFTKHHLTVTAAGFPCKLARLDDDISFDAISAFTQTLINQELCPPIIRLEKLSSFPHCAYIL